MTAVSSRKPGLHDSINGHLAWVRWLSFRGAQHGLQPLGLLSQGHRATGIASRIASSGRAELRACTAGHRAGTVPSRGLVRGAVTRRM